MNNKIQKTGVILTLILAVSFLIVISANIATAVTPDFQSVCCEKTTYGAFCQNSNPSMCDVSLNPITKEAYRTVPTSCDATSYCRQGCCYDSQEGVCMENTPQLVCQRNNGTWADSAQCEIPQCNLGCCILDNQASFATLVRCKKLAGFYGVSVNFRTDIKSEADCIAVAQSQDKGACVFEEDFTRTCKLTTRADCDTIGGKKVGNSTASGNITFYKDYLCSAEELGTNCGPTEKTICIPGKDEVYFVDSCGNHANIYDATKIKDKAYWKKIVQKKDSCGYNSKTGSANSAGCGNCDYFSGSYCRQYDKSKDKSRPTYGNSICRDLNCYKTSDGNNYKHGESWCIYDAPTGKGQDPAGSRQWKHVCIAGEEIVEPCEDFRTEICIQDIIQTDKGVFQQAGCAKNEFKDCVNQKSQKDCENTDKRDCQWIDGVIGSAIFGLNQQSATTTQAGTYTPNNFTAQSGSSLTGKAIFGGSDDSSSTAAKVVTIKGGVCVPNYPPGLEFWKAGSAQAQCSLGNAQCEVEFETKGLFSGGTPKATKNAECLSASWQQKNELICKSLGDCTGSEGVYKYLESGKSGITGTISKIALPFIQARDAITGFFIKDDASLNKGLVEDMKKK